MPMPLDVVAYGGSGSSPPFSTGCGEIISLSVLTYSIFVLGISTYSTPVLGVYTYGTGVLGICAYSIFVLGIYAYRYICLVHLYWQSRPTK